MNELARVIREEGIERSAPRSDGWSTTERSWQPEPFQMHIGFRPE
jgi:hypothetical protein